MDIETDRRNGSKQKRTTQIRATISDDRTRGSEFEAKGRIFRALKRPFATKQSEIDDESPQKQRQHQPPPQQLPRQQPPLQELSRPPPTVESAEEEDEDVLPNRNRTTAYDNSYGVAHESTASDFGTKRRSKEFSFDAFVDQNGSLDNALRLISRALNIRDGPPLTMEALQAYVLDLKSKERAQTPTVQLIHRVCQQSRSRGTKTKMYLDQPIWLEGETSSREALAGNLPLSNISSYLSKHPSVCCFFNRDYDIISLKRTDAQDEGFIGQAKPKHTTETVVLVTAALTTAVARFLDYYDFGGNLRIATWVELPVPYTAIYHTRGDVLIPFLRTLTYEQQIQFLVLRDHIIFQYQDEYNLVDGMIRWDKITQEYIEYLFKPGDIIVQGLGQNARGYLSSSWLVLSKDQVQGAQVFQTEEGDQIGQISTKGISKNTFEIKAWSWNFDGEFSKEDWTLRVKFDTGDYSEKNIADLSIRPLCYVDELTKARLKTRGEWFWKCRVRQMVSYTDMSKDLHYSSDERYMVDMPMYRELHKSDKPYVRYLGPQVMEQEHPPDKNFIYPAPLTVKAYNLKRKKWVDLQLDGFREVSWNTQAFESLVLKGKTKRLIQALISNQIEAEKSTDLISGKGIGLILLLHGGPGTGKTLTAESVAEIAKKPLYPVTCGDIGTKPEDVESYLESVLYLGKTWGCVVLLDEADVFLEQRSLEDLHRNALVSVFLRVLEYYDGILILTSNRVGTFDEAFRSRIQLAVHYSSLTTYQRTQIWQNFLQRLEGLNEEGIDFIDLKDNIEKLASKEMNGREIRNAITTARQYARWERRQAQDFKLNYNLMKEVIETAGEFDEYINTLNGGLTQEQLAKEDGIR